MELLWKTFQHRGQFTNTIFFPDLQLYLHISFKLLLCNSVALLFFHLTTSCRRIFCESWRWRGRKLLILHFEEWFRQRKAISLENSNSAAVYFTHLGYIQAETLKKKKNCHEESQKHTSSEAETIYESCLFPVFCVSHKKDIWTLHLDLRYTQN